MKLPLIAVGLIVLSGCAAEAATDVEEETTESEAQAAAEGIGKAAIGEYALNGHDAGGRLFIESVAPLKFSLTVVRKTGGGSVGAIEGAKGTAVKGAIVYQKTGCKIAMRPGEGTITVTQTGTCDKDGFGAFVDGSGTYTRLARKGSYGLSTDQKGGTLTIDSATRDKVVFDLTVVTKGGSGHVGDLENRTAKREGDLATYAVGDCKLELRLGSLTGAPRYGTVKVTQRGACQDAGFGAFVDASGAYEKK